MDTPKSDGSLPRDKMNCTVGFVWCFLRVPLACPWQHGTGQQGWHTSGTLRKQFPNLTGQLMLSLSIEDFLYEGSLFVGAGDAVVVGAREGEDAILHGVVRHNRDALSL